jgi:hypothetical protein
MRLSSHLGRPCRVVSAASPSSSMACGSSVAGKKITAR